MIFTEGTWHTQIIRAHAEAIKQQGLQFSYLEIGIRTGTTWQRVSPFADIAHAVDIDPGCSLHVLNRGQFFAMSSDDYFERLSDEQFNIIFIDGLHTYEQVKRDFNNAIRHLEGSGTIYLHDTWPVLQENEALTGTAHEFATQLEESGYNAFTFRQFPGLTVVQNPRRRRFLDA